MDDKIKRLAEQAGWDMGDEVCGFTTRLERFAELLVQEKNDEIERLRKYVKILGEEVYLLNRDQPSGDKTDENS